ncbi:MAG TPA: metal ABC transporter substrate-binding protein [Acidimicrobiales bacterium]|nr:metal ABC transporter substrate-binding protein [Acidimicrobiales bacterium]
MLATALVVASLAGACGDGGSSAGGDHPSVVVTTSVLGDVVRDLVGEGTSVAVLVPAGADPHELQPSARQVAEMREADLLVVNGGGLEAGLDDAMATAVDEGVPVFEAIDHVPTLPAATGARDGHGDGRHPVDPHFFTDPARMARAAEALADRLATTVPGLATDAFRRRAAAVVADLRALDAEVAATLEVVPPERRRLATTHDLLAYLADRYGFEVLGSVVGSLSEDAGPSARDIAALAARVRDAGVPAVFTDASSSRDLAEALADEAGGLDVVVVHGESLGEPGSGADTYAGMIRTDAERIAAALAPPGTAPAGQRSGRADRHGRSPGVTSPPRYRSGR